MNDSSQHCLVLPDIHQNIDWAEAVLQKEAPAADRIVVLGDYFDTKVEAAADVAQTCLYLSQLEKRYDAPFTFLVGNHDLPYLYDLHHQRRPDASDWNPYFNGAYKPYLSESIQGHLAPQFLRKLEPFAFAQGWILSHAGLHPRHLASPDSAGLQALYDALKPQVLRLPSDKPQALAAVGAARGGTDAHGGIVWQDWFKEFEDALPWPQIVGHTLIPEPNQKGRSWDLDTKNGSYGILRGGELEIRSHPKE
ncbi:metallophosphoesterase [Pelagicoccus sp. NFK12]|uniref:Metallophosphoesterase n=1 Tax=Pelagicoccus enzymogenes TaxID=2773457 RepID=A0A927FD91_9BACT|nr:metallophosphoesterase family protein [Pelagicoccus enzymogenes]MBD5782230.1 metallophosphoesterase [Pelagicoccus enzymogenes]